MGKREKIYLKKKKKCDSHSTTSSFSIEMEKVEDLELPGQDEMDLPDWVVTPQESHKLGKPENGSCESSKEFKTLVPVL